MNLCFIGKHKYPKDIFSNEQDMKTWRSLAAYFDKLFIIAQSPDFLFHRYKESNISIYLMPRFGYIGFIKQAVCLGFYLNYHYGIDIFDSSEIIGGGVAATILKAGERVFPILDNLIVTDMTSGIVSERI